MTIADVLRHEGGMPVFSQQMNIEDCFPENLKNNNIGKIIEDEELNFPEGEYRQVNVTFFSLLRNCIQAGVPRPEQGHDTAGGVQEGGA